MAINNQQFEQTPATFLKTISIIYIALLAGQIMFAAVAFYLNQSNSSPKQTDDVFIYIVPIMAASGFLIGNFLFKKQLAAAVKSTSLKGKLMVYQSAVIIRSASLEGASLFGIVSFMLTGNLLLLGVSGIIILYFIYLRPTKQKIEDDLELNYEEKAQFDNANEVLK